MLPFSVMSPNGNTLNKHQRITSDSDVGPPHEAPAVVASSGSIHFLPAIRIELGGVVRALLDLVDALLRRGNRVLLLTADPKDIRPEWRVDRNFRLVIVSRGLAGRLGRSGVVAATTAIQPGMVLHLHGMWDPAALQLAAIARRRRVPYVITPHGMLDEWSVAQKRLKKLLFTALVGRRFLRAASMFHCTASGELQQSRRWFAGRPAVVIPLLIDVDAYRKPVGPRLARGVLGLTDQDTEPLVLFLSRVHPKKGVGRLIDACALLRDRGVRCKLVIVGPAEPDYMPLLLRHVESLALRDRVQFVDTVRGDEKVSFYQAADVFVLPTMQENFGLVLIEAMVAGAPVVTTKGVDIWPELTEAGAIICDPKPAALADAISSLLGDPDRRRRMVESGRAWVAQDLDPDRTIIRYEALYRDVMKCRTPVLPR